MLGTFGGALEARHIDASNGKLVAEVTGEVETEEGVLRDPPYPRGHAIGRSRRKPRHGGARARNLCDALSVVSDAAQCDPAYVVLRTDLFGLMTRNAQTSGRLDGPCREREKSRRENSR